MQAVVLLVLAGAPLVVAPVLLALVDLEAKLLKVHSVLLSLASEASRATAAAACTAPGRSLAAL